MVEEEANAVWVSLHPGAQEQVSPETLAAQLETVRPGIKNLDSAVLHDVQLLHVTGILNGPTLCGVADQTDPQHRIISVQATNESIAVVAVRMPGSPIGTVATLQFRQWDGQWRLWAVNAGHYELDGHDAGYFEAAGDAIVGEPDQLVPAVWYYEHALSLSGTAPYVKNADTIRLADKIETIRLNPLFAEQTSEWSIGGKRFTILGLGVLTTLSDYGVQVAYISHGELTAESTRPEAQSIRDYLIARYPALAHDFEYVVVISYDERPVDPQKEYPIYRNVLPLSGQREAVTGG
jgi:hypothetical protein